MYWRVSKKKLEEMDADGRIWWGKDGNNVPAIKRFLSEVKQGVVPQTLWTYDQVGHTQDAKKQLLDVLQFEASADVFSTPKPVQLMERVLRIATNPDDIVLDFFAGSGTLAQAIAKLNAEDGGTRKFILVSNTEATDDQPDKNLCRDVCAQRVRKVMGGYTNAKGEAMAGLGGGFAYLRARRVPKHRLTQKLDHPEIWNALQLLHARPVRPWSGEGFAVEADDTDDTFAYLANAYPASVTRLNAWLEARGARPAVIYSWVPERYRIAGSPHDWRPIPQHLRERFGR